MLNGLFANHVHKYKCINAMKLVDLKDLVKEDLKVNLTWSQLRREKLFTMAKLEGDLTEEYSRLWDYLGKIKRSNPFKVYRLIPK